MKTLFKTAIVAAALLVTANVEAKTMLRDTTIGHKIGMTAKKVGHKTSQIAANGASTVVDKKYEDKCGPHGETVYINEHSRYYYVNKMGHRVYAKKSQLMDKKM